MGNKEIQIKEKPKEKKIYSNGDSYEGELIENIRHGYGIYYFNNGDRYEGMWFNNLKHGTGVFFDKNGDFYEGWWHHNNKEGVGTYYYCNGDRYYGEWKDDKKQGKGFIYFDDGSKFIGEFRNDKRHGKGEFIDKSGTTFYQDWKEGNLMKQVEKYKVDKMDFIDYRELNSDSFEKYLENKQNVNMIQKKEINSKSKYVSLEIAKYLKSKHPEGFYDSMRIFKNNNLLLEKPEINQWNFNDVAVWVSQIVPVLPLNLVEILKENNINGKNLLKIDADVLINLLNLKAESIIVNITKSLELIRKLDNQNYIKSINKSTFKYNKETPSNIKSPDTKFRMKFDKKIEELDLKEEDRDYGSDHQVAENKQEIANTINENNNEIVKNDNNDQNTKLKRLDDLEKTHALNMRTMTLNGLNFFINYDELSLSRKVGEGGFGEVYLGTWNGKHIAVKKLTLKQTSKDRSVFLRFINEINIISSLRHPNIVLYMGASIENNNYYMITDYLPKGSLFDYIHRTKGKFTEKEQIHIAFEIAVALKYLHSRNIIHCDLKSSNILIDDNWKIKIGDFGLSRFINKKNPSENSGRIGTPHWMAPEILKGGNYEESADVYSYGMILWEILSLEIPYFGIDPRKLMILVAEEKKIVEVPKKGNIHIRNLTKQCLEYDPSRRPTLNEIVSNLEKVINENKFANICLEELHEFLY